MEEGGSAQQMRNLNQFNIFDKKMTLEDAHAQLAKMKRLNDMKAVSLKKSNKNIIGPKNVIGLLIGILWSGYKSLTVVGDGGRSPDSPAEEAKTEPSVWDDEPVDVNPFGGKNIAPKATTPQPQLQVIPENVLTMPLIFTSVTQADGSNLCMKKTDFKELLKTSPYVVTFVVVEKNNIISEAPLQVQPLLRKFSDVIPNDIPPGLPIMRAIQHCIDFIPGSAIPNRPAYRMNLKEFTEL
nr:reverse transcriptase domain-containing protein [Tanacetum cinerariifolium]